MENEYKNPFIVGDRVVCVDEHIPGPETIPDPKKGEVLTVGFIRGEDVGFEKYNTEKNECWYSYWHFAPVQDATEMEEEPEFAGVFVTGLNPFLICTL